MWQFLIDDFSSFIFYRLFFVEFFLLWEVLTVTKINLHILDFVVVVVLPCIIFLFVNDQSFVFNDPVSLNIIEYHYMLSYLWLAHFVGYENKEILLITSLDQTSLLCLDPICHSHFVKSKKMLQLIWYRKPLSTLMSFLCCPFSGFQMQSFILSQ